MRLFTQCYLDVPDFQRNAADVGIHLRRLLELGAEFIENVPINAGAFVEADGTPMSPAKADMAASLYGLAALALRQSQAIVCLLDSGLGDQSFILARSLYETTINLKTIAFDHTFGAAQEFVDFQACVNHRIRRWFAEADSKVVADAIAADTALTKILNDDYDAFKLKYPTKPESSWHATNLVDRAAICNFSLRAHYQWLCSFTHSSTNAVRSLFVDNAGDFKVLPVQRHGLIPFFTLFCLVASLETAFECFGYQNDDADGIILWVADPTTKL